MEASPKAPWVPAFADCFLQDVEAEEEPLEPIFFVKLPFCMIRCAKGRDARHKKQTHKKKRRLPFGAIALTFVCA